MTKVSELISANVASAIINYQTWGGVLYNVKAYGAKGDGLTNDTSSINNAITAANGAGGGTVYLPIGKYVINALTLKIGVRLVGENYLNNNVFAGASDHRGTWLYCIDTVSPAVLMLSTTKIQNVGFFYPNQNLNSAPVVYPPTIKTEISQVKMTIQEVMLQNSYIGIECNTSHENLTIEKVQGLPLFKGIVLDQGSDIDRISDVNFSYNCWYEAGTVLKRWIADNAIAFTIRKSDWGYMSGCNCFGYQTALLIENSPVSGVPSGFNFSRNGFDACYKPIIISGGVGCKFEQTTVTQYNNFDLTLPPQHCISVSNTDQFTFRDTVMGPTYGHGFFLNINTKLVIDNVMINDFGRATSGTPAKFGIYIFGGCSKLKITNCCIDAKTNTNTYGIYLDGTNDRLIITENQVTACTVASIFLGVGSSFVICKNNQSQTSGALADNLGAVTKDVSANM